jgi:hypothetical protein
MTAFVEIALIKHLELISENNNFAPHSTAQVYKNVCQEVSNELMNNKIKYSIPFINTQKRYINLTKHIKAYSL